MTKTKKVTFSSAGFRIIPHLGQVVAPSGIVKLSPVNMRVLVVLLEQAGDVLSRAEIFDRVWKNQSVSDDTLTRCISDIRNQLGKYADQPKLIETIPKRGYLWLPAVVMLEYGDRPQQPLADAQSETSATAGSTATVDPASNNPAPNNTMPDNSGAKQPPTNSAETSAPGINKKRSGRKWIGYSLWGLLVTAVVFSVLGLALLWTAKRLADRDIVRIAVLPVYAPEEGLRLRALELGEALRRDILATENLRFIASNAVANRPQNPYPYFIREFGTQWIIEGEIRGYPGGWRMSLSLVDARSAIVTLREDLEIREDPEPAGNQSELRAASRAFIAKIDRLLVTKAE